MLYLENYTFIFRMNPAGAEKKRVAWTQEEYQYYMFALLHGVTYMIMGDLKCITKYFVQSTNILQFYVLCR